MISSLRNQKLIKSYLVMMILISITLNQFCFVKSAPTEKELMGSNNINLKRMNKRFANYASPNLIDKCIMACASCSEEDLDEVIYFFKFY
jgi:hypothetical protein